MFCPGLEFARHEGDSPMAPGDSNVGTGLSWKIKPLNFGNSTRGALNQKL